MPKSAALGLSAVVAAFVTHGMVFSGVNFSQSSAPSAYQQFFRAILVDVERLWSYAHGWDAMTHIRDFGGFYGLCVHLICPLIGFAFFWALSRRKVGMELWRPAGVVLLLAIPDGYVSLVSRDALPWVEVARTMMIVLAMVWSVGVRSGGLRRSLRHVASEA